MTSPAKSCSILLCALLLMAAGCKKDDPVPPLPEDLHGNVERPTWTAIEVPDMTSSMTAVVKVTSLNGQIVNDSIIHADDLLAAFSGDICPGAASPQDGLFYLYIAAPLSVSGNGLSGEAGQSSVSEAVTLRYYSAHYKNLFEAKDAFPFVNDDHLGTVAEPLIPAFVVVK